MWLQTPNHFNANQPKMLAFKKKLFCLKRFADIFKYQHNIMSLSFFDHELQNIAIINSLIAISSTIWSNSSLWQNGRASLTSFSYLQCWSTINTALRQPSRTALRQPNRTAPRQTDRLAMFYGRHVKCSAFLLIFDKLSVFSIVRSYYSLHGQPSFLVPT